MPDYRMFTLQQQLDVLEQEQKNAPLLNAKAQMWGNVTLLLNQNGDLVQTETDKLEPDWTDPAGVDFVARARNTRSVLAEWVDNITGARPDRPLLDLSIEIPKAFEVATKNKASLDDVLALKAQHPSAVLTSDAELQRSYAEPSGVMMNHIAELYRQAGEAVTKAVDGRLPDEVVPEGGAAPPGGGGGAAVGGGGGVPAGIGAGGGGAGGIPGGLPGGGGGGGIGDLPPVNGVDPETGLPPGAGTIPGPTEGVDTIGGGGAGAGGAGVGGGGAGGLDQNPELSGGLGAAPITAPSLAGGLGGGGTGGLPGPTGGISTIPPIAGPIGGGGTGTGTGTRPIPGGTGPIGTGPIGGGPGGGGGGIGTGPITGGGLGPITGGGLGPVTGGGLGPITGGGSGNSNGSGSGTGSGAGVKLPGVSLGAGGGVGGIGGGLGGVGGVGGATTGSTSIPTAAAPFQAPAGPAPSGAAPAATPLTATSGGTGSGGMGGAGMMPPMGMGGGAGGGGAGLNSAAASRPVSTGRNRRKEREVTPGLPVMLSGKAGQADMNAFTGRGRKQAEESDVPTTVQLIDEDLWQVEQKQAVDERVAAPVRRAH